MNIDELKKLAGIDKESEQPSMGENISHTAQELKDRERKMGLRPGDPDWFKLWFSRPYLSGPVQFRGRKKK
tara:strand:+ start:381 stop:593 length:213 start_codon:yes stop_codon:yes gene_type:complete